MSDVILTRRVCSDGTCKTMSVYPAATAELVRNAVENALFSDRESGWSNEFGLGFIYGMLFTVDGTMFTIDPEKAVDYAHCKCNEHYGNAVNLIEIVNRLKRQM